MKQIIITLVLVVAFTPLTAVGHGNHQMVADMPLHLHLSLHVWENAALLVLLVVTSWLLRKAIRKYFKH